MALNVSHAGTMTYIMVLALALIWDLRLFCVINLNCLKDVSIIPDKSNHAWHVLFQIIRFSQDEGNAPQIQSRQLVLVE